MSESTTTKPAAGTRSAEPGLEPLYFERLMECLPDVVYFKDLEGRFVCVNNAHAEHLGLASPGEAIGKTDRDFFPPDLAQQKDADERSIIRSGKGIEAKEESSRSLTGTDRWVLTTKLPLYAADGTMVGTFGISRDITEINRARKSLQEQHSLLKTLIEILPCRVSIKDREGRFRLINEAYRSAFGLSRSDAFEGKLLSDLVNDPRASQIVSEDRAVLERGVHILNREELEKGPHGEDRWMLLSKVPLRDSDANIVGIVSSGTDITAQKAAESRAIAAQRELQTKNRQMEAELNLACDLQRELMTSSLQTVSAQLDQNAPFRPALSSIYEPSQHLAGDFFYLVPCSPTCFAVLLCDVMGHGVKAALVTTLIRGLVANLKLESIAPAVALEQLNERLCGLLDRPSMPRFVTALMAKIDTSTGTAEIANAGHPWPLMRSQQGFACSTFAEECGPALGLIRGASYANHSLSLPRGSDLLFFTDGLIEETNSSEEEFSQRRLCAAFASSKANNPAQMLGEILAEIRSFSGNTTQRDDYCALLACF